MSIIIVEGPDGGGKSTLIRKLRERTQNYFWIASSSGRPRSLLEISDAIHWLSQCVYLSIPVICDRFPLISESIYGPVLRDQSLLDQLGRREQIAASEFIRQVERVIYCRPPIETLRENISAIGIPQLKGVAEKLDTIVAKYDEIMDTLRDDGVFVQQYDYTKWDGRFPFDSLFFGSAPRG